MLSHYLDVFHLSAGVLLSHYLDVFRTNIIVSLLLRQFTGNLKPFSSVIERVDLNLFLSGATPFTQDEMTDLMPLKGILKIE